MSLSVTQVVNALLCSGELYCPSHQSGVAVAGATNAMNARQSEAVAVSLFFPPPHPHALNAISPTHGHLSTLPSFARIKRPRWRPVGLNNRHLQSHRKIGGCEQSNRDVVAPSVLLQSWTIIVNTGFTNLGSCV